ncbi:MAG TPA: CBS domain-containing protein [Polyangiaceae bacterium]
MKPRDITIAERMTRTPQVIGLEQSLTTAHHVMRSNGIRHLPVLHGGKLVGVVSQRDLHFVEALRDVNPDEVTVEEAMTQDVYAVPPRTPLREVVSEMAERKLGSAVIVEGQKIVGVFTTVDALDTLAGVLASSS